jgi:hypothetical protein
VILIPVMSKQLETSSTKFTEKIQAADTFSAPPLETTRQLDEHHEKIKYQINYRRVLSTEHLSIARC